MIFKVTYKSYFTFSHTNVVPTVSTPMQPWGCIFQNGFLGEFNLKNPSKSGLFNKKEWGSIQENPLKLDFSHYLGRYSRVGLHW